MFKSKIKKFFSFGLALLFLASASFFVFGRYFKADLARAGKGERVIKIYPKNDRYNTAFINLRSKYSGWIVAGGPYRGTAKFELSSIPSDATITNIKFYGYPRYCRSGHDLDIYELSNDPVASSRNILWNDTRNGKRYVKDSRILNPKYGCKVSSYSTGVDLGSDAVDDMQDALNSIKWFGLGFSSDYSRYGYFYGYNYKGKQPYLEVTYIINTAPNIISASAKPAVQSINSVIQFQAEWNDSEKNNAKMFVCKEDSLINQTCGGGTWCDSVNFSSNNLLTCDYTTKFEDEGQQNYYLFICDNEGACTDSVYGAFFVQSVSSSNEDGNSTTTSFYSDEIFISQDGFIGIGTDEPTEKLELKGNFKIDGDILSDGDICIGKCE